MTGTGADEPATPFPLGPLQEPIWNFWRHNPQSPAYVMPEVYFFEGVFDLAAARFALHETARRHEALRTTFHETADGVVQIVSPDPERIPIDVVDLRTLSGAEQAERLESAISAAADAPFDLTARPAITLTVMLLSDDRTGLVLAAHQIVCDGISIAVVVDDFGKFYRSARLGTTPDPEPAVPGYRAFVTEQLAGLADDAAGADLAYWSERLAGAIGSVLPGDSTSVSTAPFATMLVSMTLDTELAAAVSAFSRRAESTPFAVLFGAMNVMIAAATGGDDVCIGVTTSSRGPRFARTVGMLANTVVPRSRVDLSRTFTDTLADVSLGLLDAIDYQDVPFSRVLEVWRKDAPSDAELVRTTFSAGTAGGLSLGEGNLSERVSRTSQGPFDLGVVCDITAAGIALDWQYALRAYSPRLADRYCDAYLEILATLLRQPDNAMDSLGLTEILKR
ncbi:condensation domain-containing protein [Actinophytocola gossypii]|uniref:Condensation domain-containing protein n=1 Tax=Actinophytocola gossypii TaxID=2812003 RepID=A0ABT2J3C2_9PSEU|nr:condensation domain-containing protein [Actinophytocola gossypii]MCT2582336.1 hypothetical protein [Actinophytocola gossypii]